MRRNLGVIRPICKWLVFSVVAVVSFSSAGAHRSSDSSAAPNMQPSATATVQPVTPTEPTSSTTVQPVTPTEPTSSTTVLPVTPTEPTSSTTVQPGTPTLQPAPGAAPNLQPSVQPSTPTGFHELKVRLSGSMCLACLHELQRKLRRIAGVKAAIVLPPLTRIHREPAPEKYAEARIIYETKKLTKDQLKTFMERHDFRPWNEEDFETTTITLRDDPRVFWKEE